MCGSFNAITARASQPVVKVIFISEETQQYDLKSAFDVSVRDSQEVSSFLSVEGIAVEWKKKDTPHLTWQKIQENIIKQNASAVVSFLPPTKNHILENALSKTAIPIIGLQSLTEEFYRSKKVREQTYTNTLFLFCCKL